MWSGTVDSIHIAPAAKAPTQRSIEVEAVPGAGSGGGPLLPEARHLLQARAGLRIDPDRGRGHRSGRAGIQGDACARRSAAQCGDARCPSESSGGPRLHDWRTSRFAEFACASLAATWRRSPDCRSSKRCAIAADCGRRSLPGRDPGGRCGARINMMDPTPRSRGSGCGKVLRVVSLVGGTGAIAR